MESLQTLSFPGRFNRQDNSRRVSKHASSEYASHRAHLVPPSRALFDDVRGVALPPQYAIIVAFSKSHPPHT
jgi:hypothetical protein